MNRFQTLLLAALLAGANVARSATPVLRYAFDEAASGTTAALDSGRGTLASSTFVGAATRTNNTPGGLSAAALNANGANGSQHYLSGGDADKLDGLSNLTVTCWVNFQGTPAVSDRLVSKLYSDGTRATGFDLRVVTPPSGALAATNFGLGFAQINAQLISGLPTVNASAAFSAGNAWTFLAVTYDGANVRFWRGATQTAVTQAGGALAKPATFGTPADTAADFRIGSTAATSSDRTPPGWFDDLRIYDAALSSDELEAVRTENVPAPPLIAQQPQSQTGYLGTSATFSVVASGSAPLAYQWYFASDALQGATNASLTLTSLSATHAGSYFVVVTNLYGSATSSEATLTISTPAPPELLSAASSPTRQAVLLTFAHPVADTATNAGNFGLSGGVEALGGTLNSDFTQLTLATTPQAPNTTYTVTLSGIRDRTPEATLAPSTNVNVLSSPLYGPAYNAPQSAAWTLLASLNLPGTANFNADGTPYTIDHRLWVTNFSRVAYYLELQQGNGPLQFVWAAMDAFTGDAMRLGVPSLDTGAVFQQPVTNLEIGTSVPGLVAGSGLDGGRIRFFPGDAASPATAGAGLMELTNSVSGQLIFTLSNWGAGGAPTLGIGTNLAGASAWSVKRLLIYALPQAAAPADADIVVYGGTSGGVAAAVQAARLGKRAVLLCTDNHLGGLSSGGLGWTDIGSNGGGYIGGVALEFYRRNGARYNQGVRWNLEPHVAEQIFAEMLAEAGVPVVFNQRLAALQKSGPRITQVTMADGSVYRGKMFIDTTYEGDLMAMAGVSFTVGREGTNTYNETFAGVLNPGNGGYAYDPYVAPGNPASGLLPLAHNVTLGPRGGADNGVQAYNFRMCFTKTAANLLPVTAPVQYSDARFELLARYLEAVVAKDGSVALGDLMTLDRPPATGKYDINNNGSISTDFVGESWTWHTNTFAARAALWQAHEDYMRGFFVFLASNPRVPDNVRSAMQSWGMCKDEFLDTGGWPHALYVREARRMVGDYVMTQQNCQGSRTAPDAIGLGAYAMDSHLIWRLASGGVSVNEGGMFNSTPSPFPISYRSIIPRAGECENVFCTFALSASHVAFGSCRMEPVFMITSQSAATAAAFAIDDDVPVQQVSYDKLALQLRADGQVIPAVISADGGIVVDDAGVTGVTIAGPWSGSAAVAGFWGSDYLTDGNTNKGACSVTFAPTLPADDTYEVYLRWTANANRAANVPVDIIYPGGTNTVFVNQQVNGGSWELLLTTNFTAGTGGKVVIRTEGTTGYVIADAVKFASSNVPPATVQIVASDAQAGETTDPAARVTFFRSGDADLPLTLNYALSGSASNGVDYAALPGLLTLPAGLTSTSLVITVFNDALAEGDERVTLTLQAGAGYSVGALSNATVTIFDTPAPNRPPVAANTAAVIRQGRALVLPAETVLQQCRDPDCDTLVIGSVSPASTGGAPVLLAGGTLTCTPAADFLGQDRITYTVSDGRGGVAEGTVDFTVLSDAQVTPSLLPLALSAGGVGVTFAGAPGFRYQVERAAEVAGPWFLLTNIVCDPSGFATLPDPDPPAGRAFYRAVAP